MRTNFKTDEDFHQHLEKVVKDFHSQMNTNGFNLKLTKLSFAAPANDPNCPCGFEFIIDPKSGQVTGKRCKRCPPPPTDS